MAERERLPNKERRNQAREERKRREAEAAARQKQSGLRTALIAAGVLVVVGAVLAQAFLGGPASIDDAILISSSDADAARQAAGCEMLVEREPLEDRTHFEAASAPSADSMYGDGIRPTHSGPHMLQFHPIVSAGAGSQIDERSSTHNLEHGSVIAWYDPEQSDAAGAMGDWSETLNANGFAYSNSGAAIMVAPYTDPGISSGKAIAFRAWGVAMDCDEWDETVANSFVIDHYGTHGIAPERTLGRYPEGVLEYDDVDVEDNTDAPLDEQLMPEGEGEGDDTSTEPDAETEDAGTEDTGDGDSDSDG